MVEPTPLFTDKQKKPTRLQLLEAFKQHFFTAFEIDYPFDGDPEDITTPDYDAFSDEAALNDQMADTLMNIEEELYNYFNEMIAASHPHLSADEHIIPDSKEELARLFNLLMELDTNHEFEYGQQTIESIDTTLKSSLSLAAQRLTGRTNLFEPQARGKK